MSSEDIQQLAKNYNLRVQVLPQSILVYSKMNEWLIEIDDRDNIILCHFNNPKRSCRVHQQIKFHSNNNVNNYDYVFQYINGHDDSIISGTKNLKSIR